MINVVDLHKRHGSLQVLRGITLSIAEGEVAAVIGPSGGGKSTFLRCLNGLEAFDQGTVSIADCQLSAGPQLSGSGPTLRKVRQMVGMVFQQFNLFPHKTVLENVIEAPMLVLKKSRDEAASQAKELLERVGLSEKIDVRPDKLSGGQQQRVAIARTLAMQPRVILFDEPTSALDPRMTSEVLSVMRDLAEQGQTMVVVTHAMNFAKRVANKVYVFADGNVLESGPPEQIFERPQKLETAAFVSELAEE